jgi:glycine cleavage system aminomethyltransferase T
MRAILHVALVEVGGRIWDPSSESGSAAVVLPAQSSLLAMPGKPFPLAVADESASQLAVARRCRVQVGTEGHTLEKSIAFSYLPIQYAAPGTVLDIGILGQRRSAEVVETPLYDPNSEKLLG